MKPGNAADRSGNKCQRYDADATENAPIDHPFVAYRVAVGANEQQRNHDVCKGQPVEPIKKKRMPFMSFLNAHHTRSSQF